MEHAFSKPYLFSPLMYAGIAGQPLYALWKADIYFLGQLLELGRPGLLAIPGISQGNADKIEAYMRTHFGPVWESGGRPDKPLTALRDSYLSGAFNRWSGTQDLIENTLKPIVRRPAADLNQYAYQFRMVQSIRIHYPSAQAAQEEKPAPRGQAASRVRDLVVA